jgi:hypothetical protein
MYLLCQPPSERDVPKSPLSSMGSGSAVGGHALKTPTFFSVPHRNAHREVHVPLLWRGQPL